MSVDKSFNFIITSFDSFLTTILVNFSDSNVKYFSQVIFLLSESTIDKNMLLSIKGASI